MRPLSLVGALWHFAAVHPVLFHAFGEPIHAYVVMTVVAYAGAVAIGIALARKDGHPWAPLLELAVVVVVAAVLGSKVFHTLFEARGHLLSDGTTAAGLLDLLRDDPWHWARLSDPGYVFYGGVVFGTAFGWLYVVRQELPAPLGFGDYAAPGIAWGILVGRVGCYLAGCCYGATSDVPWAVTFPHSHESHGVPVHPVQLYDAAFGAVALVVLALLWRKRRFPGEAFLLFVASYAVFRFCTELLRADADRGLWLGGQLSTSQGVALTTLPCAAVVWWLARKRSAAHPPPSGAPA